MPRLKESDSTIFLISRLYQILNSKRKIEIKLIILVIILNGFLEIFSVGSLVPLITIISSPNEAKNILIDLNFVGKLWLTESNSTLIISLIFFGLIILSNLLKILSLKLICRTTAKIAGDISCMAYDYEINRTYIDHLKIKSSSSISTMTVQLNAALSGLVATLQLISSFVISSFIVLYLINLNFQISIILLITICLLYFFIINKSKFKLINNSKIFSNRTNDQIKIIQETFGNFKEIIFSGNQRSYINKYKNIDKSIRKAQAQNQFIPVYPRYLIELIIVILIFSIITFFQKNFNSEFKQIFPILGAFIFGCQRLLPSSQLIYGSWTNIKAKQESIKRIVEYVKNIEFKKNNISTENSIKNKFIFKNLQFNNAYFNYGQNGDDTIKGIDLKIKKGDRLGVVGKSGSGKTTLLELISGLLIPYSGEILVNNIPLKYNSHTLRLFQDIISYSPQETYLSDSSIAENIALGIEKNFIDYKMLDKAIDYSQLRELINELPNGINSLVGEKGTNLSGGQKQRIGLARAIYKDSDFIILDEFTSSLDEFTENQIMKIISNLPKTKTIVIVSHRKNVLRICDNILEIKKGKIENILKREEYLD